MTGYICRKAGVPNIQTDSLEVSTAAELSGYICTSGEFVEDALALPKLRMRSFAERHSFLISAAVILR